MQDSYETLILTYHRTLERLWSEAMALHRCSGCAARDLESKLKVFSEGSLIAFELNCPGICEDARSYVRPLYKSKRLGRRAGFEGMSFKRVELISNLLCEAWSLGVKIMQCEACVGAAMLYDIRTAAAEAQHARAEGLAGSVPGGCAACCSLPLGLV